MGGLGDGGTEGRGTEGLGYGDGGTGGRRDGGWGVETLVSVCC